MKIKELFNAKKKLFLILSGIILLSIPIICLAVSLSNSKNQLIFGNYSSYMSPKVQSKIANKYGVEYTYYDSNDYIASNLRNNALDIFVTTSYEISSLASNNLLAKIDWSQFHLENISNANDALNLFTDPVQTLLNSYDLDIDGKNDNLLNYAIPYFVQDLVFIYRGEQGNISDNASWKDIMNFIINDNRFSNKNHLPKIGIIDDNRTIFSLSRIIENELKNNQNENIGPNNNENINDLKKVYMVLANYLSKLNKPSTLLADSNSLLNKIAKNELSGAILYNGDGIFAGIGGDDEVSIDKNSFHVIKPTNTLIALDLIAINKKIESNNMNKAYDIINNLCLKFDENNIDQSYIYDNFDYVNYTPVLKKFYDFILDNGYFDDYQLVDNLKTLYKITNALYFEKAISSVAKSNLSFAYIDFKSSI